MTINKELVDQRLKHTKNDLTHLLYQAFFLELFPFGLTALHLGYHLNALTNEMQSFNR